MKRLTVLVALLVAVVVAFALLAACDDPSAPASPTPVEIDIDHPKVTKKPKYPRTPKVKSPTFRKPSTGRRR